MYWFDSLHRGQQTVLTLIAVAVNELLKDTTVLCLKSSDFCLHFSNLYTLPLQLGDDCMGDIDEALYRAF
ncbi:hypothetical protein [Neosynechococcus sphagnicola]|uniref:hypothetical protein n=1 Tax=Neosynechococcus sphagnicola TaxID=1501145 RepID=UPI0012E04D28|nr:hypothetical protein [Neosynechococcus sphagnicola]